MITVNQFQIHSLIDKNANLEAKISGDYLFLFDQTNHKLIQLNLKQRLEEVRLPLNPKIKGWYVLDKDIYFLTEDHKLYAYQLKNKSFQQLVNLVQDNDLTIYNHSLTMSIPQKTVNVMNSRKTIPPFLNHHSNLPLKQSIFLSSSHAKVIASFYHLNTDGDIQVNFINFTYPPADLIDLPFLSTPHKLIYFKDNAYYMSESNHAIISTPKNKHLEFKLDHPIEAIYPFY